jgi:8-oxo-dGTP pyrophosphatase MutT (NUDIX family)
MIHTANGDYKFPGGGVEAGENHATALIREFIEETGHAISKMIQPIGEIIEQKQDAYEPDAYFVMKSYYL